MTTEMPPQLLPTQMIIRELVRFIEADKPAVICIRGRWGVGKTFAWNTALQKAKDCEALRKTNYSYVSLFGLTNLDQLKYAIFLNQVSGKKVGSLGDMSELASNWSETVDKSLKSILDTVTGKIGSDIVQAAAFASISNQIVCIDDIERKGTNLRTMDVLGLVSFLKEHKKCKVVLVLNDERLDDEKAELAKYQEKVIDNSYLYSPSPTECANLGVKAGEDYSEELKKRCVQLQLSNIRVIQKIESAILKVHPILHGYNERIFRSAIASLTLFGWAHYSEHETVDTDPPAPKNRNLNQEIISYIITKYSRGLYASTKNASADEKRWNETLRAYNFGQPDELDSDLCEGVLNGYFDEYKIRKSAEILEKRLENHDAAKNWSDAWDKFHDSFDDNATAVVGAFASAFKEWSKSCTVADLFSYMSLLRYLGHPEKADEALTVFMNAHENEEVGFFDLDQHLFSREINDPAIRKAFAEKIILLQKSPKPFEILLQKYKNNAWNPADMVIVSQASEDEYYEMFKQHLGDDHRRLIASALSFKEISNPSPEYKMIIEKSEGALRRIAKESKINRARVQRFGVNVEDLE